MHMLTWLNNLNPFHHTKKLKAWPKVVFLDFPSCNCTCFEVHLAQTNSRKAVSGKKSTPLPFSSQNLIVSEEAVPALYERSQQILSHSTVNITHDNNNPVKLLDTHGIVFLYCTGSSYTTANLLHNIKTVHVCYVSCHRTKLGMVL